MNLSELLNAGRVRHNIVSSSKKAVLETLSELLASELPSITTQDVFNCLCNRERLGSTGLGQGVAIPHGRIAKLDVPVASFLSLGTGVAFDAPDNQPVDLVFGLLVPEEATEEHLQILAAIAGLFSKEGFAGSLRKCRSSEQLLELIINNSTND